MHPITHSCSDKWYMPWAVWPHEKYPHYCIAYAVLLGADVAAPLHERARLAGEQMLRDFWIDDALYTGVFAQEANVTLDSRPALFMVTSERMAFTAFHTGRTESNAREYVRARTHE